jgi:hypothetical protein
VIWGYRFVEVQQHLARLGYQQVGTVEGIVIFRNGEAIFTIREPNVLGSLPENLVLDAFDNAGLPPPEPAAAYVD